MSVVADPQGTALLRKYVEETCGLVLDEKKNYLVENRLMGLVVEMKCSSFGELHRKAVEDQEGGLRDRIIDVITTHETSWFRDGYPFEALQKEVFPRLFKEIKAGERKTIRIWSAAASTGQEPYSIAISALETCRSSGRQSNLCSAVSILASDVSASALVIAAKAGYGDLAMSRGMPDELRQRYFSYDGHLHVLDESVRRMVEFRRFNLLDSFAGLGKFDIVFLRNVIIYFSDRVKSDVFHRLTSSLSRGGYLFTGASEVVQMYNPAFDMVKVESGIYYRMEEKRNR